MGKAGPAFPAAAALKDSNEESNPSVDAKEDTETAEAIIEKSMDAPSAPDPAMKGAGTVHF